MNYNNLPPEEKRLISALRGLSESKRNVVLSSFESFTYWIQNSLSDIWDWMHNNIDLPSFFNSCFNVFFDGLFDDMATDPVGDTIDYIFSWFE